MAGAGAIMDTGKAALANFMRLGRIHFVARSARAAPGLAIPPIGWGQHDDGGSCLPKVHAGFGVKPGAFTLWSA